MTLPNPLSRRRAALLAGLLLCACPGPTAQLPDAGAPADAAPPSTDAAPECPFGDALPCAPEAPRGTPEAECPSGRFVADAGFSGRGICLPSRPRSTPEEACPSGARQPDPHFEGPGLCLPEAPRFEAWACPPGWFPEPMFVDTAGQDDTPEGVPARTVCRPPTLPTCPAGQLPSLQSGQCEPQGPACPSGTPWADETALRARAAGFAGAIWYVDASAAAGGLGSRATPFQALTEALGAANSGDVIALAAGKYPAEVTVAEGIALLGACTASTRLVPATTGAGILLTLRGAGALQVADLTLAGAKIGMVVVGRSGPTTVQAVRLEGSAGTAVRFDAGNTGALRFERLAVVDTVEEPANLGALDLGWGATLELSDAWFENVAGAAIRLLDPKTRLRATRLVVRNTRAYSGGWGRGVFVRAGARAEIDQALFDGVQGRAIYAYGAAAHVTLRDALIANGASLPDKTSGEALVFSSGATGAVERVLLEANRDQALRASGAGVNLTVQDLVVRGTRANALGQRGHGLAVDTGARLKATRVALNGSTECGLLATNDTTSVAMEDLVVRGTLSSAAGQAGRGISLEPGAQLQASRVWLLGNRTQGMAVLGGTAVVEDLVASDTAAGPEPEAWGAGLYVVLGGSATCTRVQLLRNTQLGGVVRGAGASLTLVDAAVRGTRPDAAGMFGRGLTADGGAALQATRLLVTGARDAAVACADAGTTLALTDAVLVDTLGWLSNGSYGYGLALRNCQASLVRTVISEATSRAIFSNTGVTLSLEDVSLSDVREGLDPPGGRAVEVLGGSAVTFARLEVQRAREVAISVDTGTFKGRDLVVRDTASSSERHQGNGLHLWASHAELTGALLSGNRSVALAVSDDASLVLTDAVVRDTQGAEREGHGGHAVAVYGARSSADLQRVILERNRETSLIVIGAEAQARAQALAVRQTLDEPCAADRTPGCVGGSGVATWSGALLELEDFLVADSSLAGINVGTGGRLLARHGLLRENLVGMNVMDPGFDFTAGLVQVLAQGNSTDLSGESMPVPDVASLGGK